jgi:hypothetical protein
MVVVRGLLVARENGAAISGRIIENGLAWLRRYEDEQLRRLALKPTIATIQAFCRQYGCRRASDAPDGRAFTTAP